MEQKHWLTFGMLSIALSGIIGSLDHWHDALKPQFIAAVMGVIGTVCKAMFEEKPSISGSASKVPSVTGLLLLIALWPTPASAQQRYTHKLQVFNVGASTPIQTTSAPAAAATCGLAPSAVTSGDTVNPTAFEYDDPATVGRVCRVPLSAFFGGLPVNVRQEARLIFVDEAAGLESVPSDPSNPFVRREPPLPPAHVRAVRGGGQ